MSRTQITEEEIKSRCEQVGLKYIRHWIDNKATYVECLCKCGKPMVIILKSISQYAKKNKLYTCKECGHKRNAEAQFIDTEEIKIRCEKVGLAYVNHYYVKEKRTTYVECLCKCDEPLTATLNDILQYGKKDKIYSCEKCGRKRTSEKLKGMPKEYCRGEKNPNYNPDLTDEDRADRRTNLQYKEWQYKVKEKANFTCDICGDNRGGNLESHHLNAHSIYKEKRYDVSNGVCLCKHCHKEFHVGFMHGYDKPCTQQDYEEFKQMKQNENTSKTA